MSVLSRDKSNIEIENINATELAMRKVLAVAGNYQGKEGLMKDVNIGSQSGTVYFEDGSSCNIPLRQLYLLPYTKEEFEMEIEKVEAGLNILKSQKDYIVDSGKEGFDELDYKAHQITEEIFQQKDKKEAKKMVLSFLQKKM